MIAIGAVVPTFEAAAQLGPTLQALRRGGVADIVVVDGGSRDATAAVAEAHGARVVTAPRGRGSQLAAGAAEVQGDWLLFVHADTRLASEWRAAAEAFAAAPDALARAGYFRFRLDDGAPAARRLERLVAWRSARLGLPYGDQGLLLSRALYGRVGGFRPLPLMEDVDLVRRLGRRCLTALPVDAVTSAERWRRGGWQRRSARNLACLSLYFLGLPPRLIARLYG